MFGSALNTSVLNYAAREKQDLPNQRKGSAIRLPPLSLLAAPRGLSQGKNGKAKSTWWVRRTPEDGTKGSAFTAQRSSGTEQHNSCPRATLLGIKTNLMTKRGNSKNNLSGCNSQGSGKSRMYPQGPALASSQSASPGSSSTSTGEAGGLEAGNDSLHLPLPAIQGHLSCNPSPGSAFWVETF